MNTMLSRWAGAFALAGLALAAVGSPGAKGPGAGESVRARIPIAPAHVMGPVIADGGPFNENFDAYAAGSGLAGQGGWSVWYSGGQDAVVESGAPAAASAPNKLRLVAQSDVVQQFAVNDGKWVFRIKTYVPSSAPPGLGGAVILMNQYGAAAIDNWSVQLAMNETMFAGSQPLPYMIESQWDGGVLPLVLDAWVEIRSEIDLDIDQVAHFYNNQPLGVPHLWTNNNFSSGPGITSIACLDLWSNGINPIYFDDISLTSATCYPDCDGSGALTIADFGCFQTKFVQNDPYADCDGSGTLTIADFGCFQTKFVQGCP